MAVPRAASQRVRSVALPYFSLGGSPLKTTLLGPPFSAASEGQAATDREEAAEGRSWRRRYQGGADQSQGREGEG